MLYFYFFAFQIYFFVEYSCLTICHWNLHNYGMIYLLKTFLIFSIQSNDDRISTDRYNLITADHPNDSKSGGICIYYKQSIPLIKRDDICTLDNYLVTKIYSQGETILLTEQVTKLTLSDYQLEINKLLINLSML